MSLRLRVAIAAACVVAILFLGVAWIAGKRDGRRAERLAADADIEAVKENCRRSIETLIALHNMPSPLSDKAEQLLIAAASDRGGALQIVRNTIRVGSRSFATDARARDSAQWRAALNELTSRGLVERWFSAAMAPGREDFLVTKAGYDHAETLRADLLLMRRPADGVPDDASLAEFFLLSDAQQTAFLEKIAAEVTPKGKPTEAGKTKLVATHKAKVAAFREHANKLKADYQQAADSLEARRLMESGLKHEFRAIRDR